MFRRSSPRHEKPPRRSPTALAVRQVHEDEARSGGHGGSPHPHTLRPPTVGNGH